ncbi:hypothetical protein PYJP_07280 [Pyrofollis japonicus]|nr:hypothetical protein PYJP_07280 [Pyrofollis japonicus]
MFPGRHMRLAALLLAIHAALPAITVVAHTAGGTETASLRELATASRRYWRS